MNTGELPRDEQGRLVWPDGYYDRAGNLHFADSDALDTEWSMRHRRVFGDAR